MAIIIVFQGGHLEALAPPGLPFTVIGALLVESPRQTLYDILCTSSYRNLRLPTKHCVQWRFDMILKTSYKSMYRNLQILYNTFYIL